MTTKSVGPPKAAIAFTGGKDSTLVLHLLKSSPDAFEALTQLSGLGLKRCDVQLLVTFRPAGVLADFKAHPLSIIGLQAQALELPHVTCEITSPYLESYRSEIKHLREKYGITVLATGDILDVCSNFMPRAVENTGVELWTPLWGIRRKSLLELVWHFKMEPLITCVNLRSFGMRQQPLSESRDCAYHAEEKSDPNIDASRDFLGNVVTSQFYDDTLIRANASLKIDECGELGEYHTMVLDGALFKSRLSVSFEKAQDGDYGYLVFKSPTLVQKSRSAVETTSNILN